MTKYNLKDRKPFTPECDRIYTNAGGGQYQCEGRNYPGGFRFRNVISGWTLIAYGLGIYPDGTIDWDYSKGLYFLPPNPDCEAVC